MPSSSEFVNLCEAQVALLTEGLGAALSIIYLTEELKTASDTQLVPIVAHPEIALNWREDQILSFLSQVGRSSQQRLLSSEISEVDRLETAPAKALPPSDSARYPETLLPQQQMVLPLIYQDQVMGLLVTARADRAWSEAEQAQIKQIAQTLTAACILDWRAQWLAQDLQRQQLLEERKNDLFDDLLHQFRNPLTALRTFGKLLLKRLRPEDTNRSVAESIVRESDRLQELLKQLDLAIDFDIEDLLPLLKDGQDESQTTDSTRLNQSAPALPQAETKLLLGSAIDLQSYSVIAVLQPLLESATAIAQDRQLTLLTDIPADLPPVLVDQRALREILNNLIDNALKYTPAGGQISVSVHRQIGSLPHRQAIVIADTGPGIPAEDLVHLFERHYRGVQATTDIPGTGLGLAIAHDLIQQMQGAIQIFSPAANSELLPQWIEQEGTQQPSPQNPGTAAIVWLVEAP